MADPQHLGMLGSSAGCTLHDADDVLDLGSGLSTNDPWSQRCCGGNCVSGTLPCSTPKYDICCVKGRKLAAKYVCVIIKRLT